MKKVKLVCILMGVVMMFGLLGCGNYVNVKGQKLESYRESSGGGMTGGSSSLEIYELNGNTYMTYENSEWWNEDKTVTEYLVDGAILEEINQVITKNGMNRWNDKKFTNMFVADGESESYRFEYEEDIVQFSSQIYPERYRNKLSKISDVIDKYKESAVLQPGLETEPITSENYEEISHPSNGIVEIKVFQYSKDRVYFRVLNGTDENVELTDKIVITNSKGEIVVEDANKYGASANAHYSGEKSVKLIDRLNEDTYTLTIGDHNCDFTIKLK